MFDLITPPTSYLSPSQRKDSSESVVAMVTPVTDEKMDDRYSTIQLSHSRHKHTQLSEWRGAAQWEHVGSFTDRRNLREKLWVPSIHNGLLPREKKIPHPHPPPPLEHTHLHLQNTYTLISPTHHASFNAID